MRGAHVSARAVELVQQRFTYDCALAALAMASGRPYDELWTPEFTAAIEAKKGTFGEAWDKALEMAGFVRNEHFRSVYVAQLPRAAVYPMLWGRRALVQVISLNHPSASHIVFWDGNEVFDPSTKQAYRWLDQLAAAAEWVTLLKGA